jgi:hypothetical protein
MKMTRERICCSESTALKGAMAVPAAFANALRDALVVAAERPLVVDQALGPLPGQLGPWQLAHIVW